MKVVRNSIHRDNYEVTLLGEVLARLLHANALGVRPRLKVITDVVIQQGGRRFDVCMDDALTITFTAPLKGDWALDAEGGRRCQP